MSKPILTSDFGIVGPKTIVPDANRGPGVVSPSADAFEGALSSAVTRQSQADALAQRKERAQEAAQSKSRNAKKATAEKMNAADDKVADPRTARDGQAHETVSVTGTKNQDRAKDADANQREDVSSSASSAGSDDEQSAFDGQAVSEDETAAVEVTGQEQPVDTIVISVPIGQPAPAVNALAPDGGNLTVLSTPTPALADAPIGSMPAPASVAPADMSAADPALPPLEEPAALSPVLPIAASPSSDPVATIPAEASVVASNQTTSANQVSGTNGTPAVEVQTADISSPELAMGFTSPSQVTSASVEALPTMLPSAATLAQTAAVAAPLASTGLTASQRAQNGLLPAESSRASSLSNAFDIPTTVTYTAAPPAASSLGSGSAGSNPQGGAGFGSSNNRAAGTQTPSPGAGASAGIVTQDLALLAQSVALEAEAVAAAPVAEAAATPDDSVPVETKVASSPTSALAQTSATRGGFEVPASHQPTSAGRPNQVLLPLTSQIATGIVKLGQEGGGEITMRLQPANLGRVDVSMKFDDGRMTAMITADRQDTLDLLRRDAYGLERSLADAGLKMDGGGLEFSLRGDGGQRDRDDDTGRGSRPVAQIPAETELAPATPTRRTSGLSRLDMRI